MSASSPTTPSSLPDRARRVLPGGVTRSTVYLPPHPPYAVSGEGAWIRDEAGADVLDANGNYTSLIHGHAHPAIVAAATDALAHGSAFGLPTRSEVELAEVLRARTGREQWRFCNSGTEAVMMLLRAARAATGRAKIVRFRGSYHGTSPEVVQSDSHDDVLVVDQGDLDGVRAALEEHRGNVAGILIDLMPNRAGLRPADPEFASALRRLADEHGTLLLVDEIITFRLGEAGFLEQYDVDADLVSLGKVIGGGLPVGAIGGSQKLLRPFDPTQQENTSPVAWGGTFSANPVTMAAGKVALELYDAQAVRALNEAGEQVRQELAQAKVPVTGFGSLMRLHSPRPGDLWWAMYERGVLTCNNGLVVLCTAMTTEDHRHLTDAVLNVAREHPDLLPSS